MINLELLKIFVITAREKSITNASKQLFISQPALTKHIANLEKDLQRKLFIREFHGIKLTEDGRKLYNEINSSIDKLLMVKNIFNNNEIKIGTRNFILSKIFIKGITNFSNDYKEIKTSIEINKIRDSLEKLNQGYLDIVLSKKYINDDYQNICFIELGILNDVFITKYNKLYENTIFTKDMIKSKKIYVNDGWNHSVSTIHIQDVLNITKKDVTLMPQLSIIKSLSDKDSIAFITKEFFEDEIKNNNLMILKTNFEIKSTSYGIYYNKNNFDKVSKLIEYLKKYCQK